MNLVTWPVCTHHMYVTVSLFLSLTLPLKLSLSLSLSLFLSPFLFLSLTWCVLSSTANLFLANQMAVSPADRLPSTTEQNKSSKPTMTRYKHQLTCKHTMSRLSDTYILDFGGLCSLVQHTVHSKLYQHSWCSENGGQSTKFHCDTNPLS